jgi:hypothetical protein
VYWSARSRPLGACFRPAARSAETGESIRFCPPPFKPPHEAGRNHRGLLRRTIKTRFEMGRERCTLPGSGNNLTSGEPPNMSIEAHLAELERRHRALEAELNEARSHPSIDDLQIVELKRRKLLVKDEIARLQVDAVVH